MWWFIICSKIRYRKWEWRGSSVQNWIMSWTLPKHHYCASVVLHCQFCIPYLLPFSSSSSSSWSIASSLSCGNTLECADRSVMELLLEKRLTKSFDVRWCVPHFCPLHLTQIVCKCVSMCSKCIRQAVAHGKTWVCLGFHVTSILF